MVQMKSEGIQPDRISYTSAVGAAGRAREWETALALWTQMDAENIEIDSVGDACCKLCKVHCAPPHSELVVYPLCLQLALHTLLRALTAAGQWQARHHPRTQAGAVSHPLVRV